MQHRHEIKLKIEIKQSKWLIKQEINPSENPRVDPESMQVINHHQEIPNECGPSLGNPE